MNRPQPFASAGGFALSYSPMSLSKEAMKFFEEQGRKGGKIGGSKGGLTSAANMTPEQRTERAKTASIAAAAARAAAKKPKRKKKK